MRVRQLGRRLDHHLAADGEADAADPLRVDVGTMLQECDRRVDVSLALPAEEVRVAVALALAATVEEEDAVPVTGEQLRPLLRARPAGERDHRRAVPRADVPAPQSQPVARRELHVLVGRAEIGRRHMCAGCMGDDVRDRDREQEDAGDDSRHDDEQSAPAVAPPEAVVRRRDRHNVTPPNESSTRPARSASSPRVVVAGRPDLSRVVNGLGAAEHAEEADEERGHSAGARAKAAVARPRGDEQRERYEAAHQVVAGAHPRIRLQEAVVDDVQRDDADREPGHANLVSQPPEAQAARPAWCWGVSIGSFGSIVVESPPTAEFRACPRGAPGGSG